MIKSKPNARAPHRRRHGASLTAWSAMAAFFVAAPAMAAEALHVTDSSFSEPGGDRVLQESIVVEAPAARVWKAFTDEATIRAWNAPLVHVDLRDGGTIEEGDDPTAALGGPANVRHRIITYLPGRLLVLRNIAAPATLPGGELYPTIVQIVSLEPLTDKETLVTLSGSGYGTSAAYDRLYDVLRAHNGAYLVSLKTLCETPTAAGVTSP
ncbi:MAG: SRPBCC domain-containing protein [Pseudomonadota bacterium]|nr:SRPBCC domain-containing protein [Pseudomonadota bacterium]